MRKTNLIGIHSICVDIAEVSIKENNFVIVVHKSINYEMLKKQQNYNDLVDTFRKLGYNYNVLLTFEPNTNLNKEDKAKILSQLIGCKVGIKN